MRGAVDQCLPIVRFLSCFLFSGCPRWGPSQGKEEGDGSFSDSDLGGDD